MRRRLFIILNIICVLSCNAQIDEARKAYEDFKKKAQQEYNDFRKQANEQYAEFLKKAWTEYKTLPAIPRPKDESEPPVVVPEEDRNKQINDNPVPIDDVVTPPTPTPQPVPISPIKEDETAKEKVVAFTYFGTNIKIRIKESSFFSLATFDNEKVAELWMMLSEEGMMNNTIRDCLYARTNMDLCDWAYLNMIYEFSKSVYGEGNEATLLTAYIYCQSGYKMRIAVMSGKLLLMYASKHYIFDTPSINIDGTCFFPFNCKEEGSIYLSNIAFPKEQSLSLFVQHGQKFSFNPSKTRTLKAKHFTDMEVSVQVNNNLIDFFNSYPTSVIDDDIMTKWALYANTPLDENVKKTLYSALRGKINGLGQKQAANKLINWVQTAFVYEYDDKVWGHDRAFFAEESLYYPYCDCEDRSILFSRLIRDLLGLDVVLVFYPGHLATAVHFTEDVKGDYIIVDGKKYVICDPTYIGAPVGYTMEGMDNATCKVILLENSSR